MRKVKLKDIAEVYSGLSYRRYLDDDGILCNVIVQRSIQADGILADFEELKLDIIVLESSGYHCVNTGYLWRSGKARRRSVLRKGLHQG